MSEIDSRSLVRNARALVGSAGLDHPHRRGMDQAARGNYQAALESFREAIAAVPDAPWSYLALAQVLAETDARAEAVEAFHLALERTPTNAVPLREAIATGLRDVGELDTAIRTFREVLVAEPGRSTAVVGLARALLARAHEMGTEAAQLLVDTDDISFDEPLLAAAIEAAPRVGGLYTCLAQSLARRGDRTRAMTVIQVGLAHDPDDPTALLLLAELLAADEQAGDVLSDDQQARLIELVEQAVGANPNDSDLLLRRARLLGRHGSPAKAVEAWRAVAANEPDVALWHRELGDCLARTGDFEAAGEAYDRAVALGYLVY